MIKIHEQELTDLIELAPTRQVSISSIKKFLGAERAGAIGVVIENLKDHQGSSCANCMSKSSKPRNVVPICKIHEEIKVVQIIGMKLLCEPCFGVHKLLSDAALSQTSYTESSAYQKILLPQAKSAKIKTTVLTKELNEMAKRFEQLFSTNFTWDLTYLKHRNMTDTSVRHFDFNSFKIKSAQDDKNKNKSGKPKSKVREYHSSKVSGPPVNTAGATESVMPDDIDGADVYAAAGESDGDIMDQV